MALGAALVDAAVGQRAWRISARVCVAGGLLAGVVLDMDYHAGDSPRGLIGKDRVRSARAPVNRRRAALDRGQFHQSVWMEAARAYLCLSFQSLPDGSHRRVPVAQFPRHRAEMLSRAA